MSFPSQRNLHIPIEFETEEQRDLYDFMYDATLDYENVRGTILWGAAMQIAHDHPDWTFWQVVKGVKELLANRTQQS